MFNYNEASPVMTNCTFTGNSADRGGGMYNQAYPSPLLTNSILWGDTPDEIFNADSAASPIVTYSDVQGGYTGEGNIDADPLFADPLNNNFHLTPNSPAIDAGSNAAPYLPLYDFDGDTRILDGNGDEIAIVDIGVDEVVNVAPVILEVSIDIKPSTLQNNIRLTSRGTLPVAILTSGEFDAATVDPDTVLFAGAAPVQLTMEDVDLDGDLDLLLYFQILELILDETSTEATLTGATFDGMLIQGTDTVNIIP